MTLESDIKELQGLRIKNNESPSGCVDFPNEIRRDRVLTLIKKAKEELKDAICEYSDCENSKGKCFHCTEINKILGFEDNPSFEVTKDTEKLIKKIEKDVK